MLIPLATQQVVLPSPQFEAATIANIDAKFGPTSASDAFYKQIFALYNGAPGARAEPAEPSQDPLAVQGLVTKWARHDRTLCGALRNDAWPPTNESLVSGRVDWNIRPRTESFSLVEYNHGHQASYTDPISPLFNINSNQPWWQDQLVETHTFGPFDCEPVPLGGLAADALFGPEEFFGDACGTTNIAGLEIRHIHERR